MIMGKPLRFFSYIVISSLFFLTTNLLFGVKLKATSANLIRVDQFGYRPEDHKVAVIVDPQLGFNEQVSFSPGQTYEVRDAKTDRTVYSGEIQLWADGKIDSQSGDKAWWFDFSEVKNPGDYYIYDPENNERSFPFDIRDDVYRQVLITATRMFFYQRSGFAKRPPFADPKWQDGAAFLGDKQDSSARYLYDKENPNLEKDMRGGWFDAGDMNKYVTFANQPIHQLLSAYMENPSIWTDDFNIPESKNGIPDLIDEIKFELDWLKRMQDNDGGVFIKIGNIDHNAAEKPSLDRRPRYYGPKCSSATIATASMFAHSAFVLQQFPALQAEANDLNNRAIEAWKWYESNPKKTDCDSQEIKSGDADRSLEEQTATSVVAAVYLFALNGDSKYGDYIKPNLSSTQPFLDDTWSRYRPHEGDALLFYAQLPEADRDLSRQILSRFQEMVTSNANSYGFNENLAPYRSYMPDSQYHWGSNAVKANYGNTNYDVVILNIDSGEQERYKIRALDHLHYLHGVNPLGMVYLSNMYENGAEYSANEMYHEWFGKGVYDNALSSKFGPAPGYLTGGANKDYTGSIKKVRTQPPMKAYIDRNDAYPVNTWEITEPGIYYQSSYLKLLSHFIAKREPQS
ncbi:glycoside hydrolase family 9 protein [Limnoraphis robusta Tam1]|uniref:Glycoside hydrolase family 9 protein n=1 Tax=Limnoraphis robusta CCNP1315 TaxID=3110306 RepID=A0ABU5U066_9CYAN|nr:glycoside hydrolase family 9 protein [Limnoraphis robusta]MEA5496057.1 glycoside hydrolase family 9 protein [Limnoraphis robusta BA-68 BA1]MEA5520332.1 glycoside hydrolase family 9 protein [Limnoraphis robusta CCNP1315]MEA5542667.1 glycoside hydrolase family 9 protein [Limnoraphis robusta Tam1]MEA5548329.1 glycoside hydrolase family 9 protein [Limnoraphis robusta CCNP1324]